MHIALMVKTLGPHGGTEEYVRAVGEALMGRGHELSCLYEETSVPHGAAWSRFLGMFPSASLDGDGETRSRTLRHHLLVHQPDVLFVQGASFSAEMYGVAAGSLALVRFVHDFRPVCLRVSKVFPVSRRNCARPLGYPCLLHGCSIGPGRGGPIPLSWNGLRAKLTEREVCRRFDRVVVASRFMRDVLLRNGFAEERLSVNPLFCVGTVPVLPPKLPSENRLIYVGQLQRFKGLSLLLSAMRRLPATFSLEVAGDGARRRRFESLVSRWNLGDRVHFHGWLTREKLAAVMDRATVAVVPSMWNEPFGLVGLEAMAYARPVVAFDVGGVSEWLTDGVTGVLVREVGAESLAAAIAELSADRARAARLGAQGHRFVQERFTLRRHVDQLLAEFDLAISTSGTPLS